MTAAEFMELALYHPSLGYYSRAEQRSGRAGDFYTSVDVGPLFGEMIAAQLAEMWEVLRIGCGSVRHCRSGRRKRAPRARRHGPSRP